MAPKQQTPEAAQAATTPSPDKKIVNIAADKKEETTIKRPEQKMGRVGREGEHLGSARSSELDRLRVKFREGGRTTGCSARSSSSELSCGGAGAPGPTGREAQAVVGVESY